MPYATRRPAGADRPIFLLHLIKPSHYDDDGYVHQQPPSHFPHQAFRQIGGARQQPGPSPAVMVNIPVIDRFVQRASPNVPYTVNRAVHYVERELGEGGGTKKSPLGRVEGAFRAAPSAP